MLTEATGNTKLANPIILSTYTNLSYLQLVTAGNENLLQSLIATFLEQTPVYLKDLEEAIEIRDFEQSQRLLHKIKPTFVMLGIASIAPLLEELDVQIANQSQTMKSIISEIIQISEKCHEEFSFLI
ncbi:MAG: Hpt domain-containing protein [Verrucomicrobia bacterium]|nr:Hpt domain-containing protein [Cytophagales bacterium]